MPIAFEKHFTPVEDIVDILCCRGLNIDNYDEALHLLTNIGYYRFSAYLYPLLETPKCNHQFKTNSSFNNALSLYNLCIIKWFVNVISPTNDMRYQLEALLNSFPNVDINAMGFPNNWGGEPLWN